MRPRAAFGLALLLLSVRGSSATLERPIGFTVFVENDATRATPQFPTGRPIQIALWYPAASSGRPLTYRDYLWLAAVETSQGNPGEPPPRDAMGDWKSFVASAGVTSQKADAFLATPMHASRDATPAPGRFPLVLIAQGNGQSAHDQAFLAELLAEKGYAVATTPSQARIGGPMQSEQDIPAQADAQAADLAFARSALRGKPQIRPGPYAVVGHSFGARSALLLAMRDSEVAALVSLDGGIGGRAGKGMLEKAEGFDRARAAAPILHLYEEGDRFMVPDLALLRSLDRCDRWLVRVDGMRHIHFTSTGVMVRVSPPLAAATSADSRTAAAWNAAAGAAVSFLDRFLFNPAAAREPLWAPPDSALLHVEELPRSSF